jgi:hypothetical protein
MAYQAGFDLPNDDCIFATDTKTPAGNSRILQHVLIMNTVIYNLGKASHSLLQLHISYTNIMLVTPLSDIFGTWLYSQYQKSRASKIIVNTMNNAKHNTPYNESTNVTNIYKIIFY